jgi:hypothetical protein
VHGQGSIESGHAFLILSSRMIDYRPNDCQIATIPAPPGFYIKAMCIIIIK